MTPDESGNIPASGTYADLSDKVVIVTGGSRGIGAATGMAFARNCSRVVVVGRDETALASTVERIVEVGGTALGMRADCTSDADLTALKERVMHEFGRVDILAAFAGGNGMPVASSAETGKHWREVMESDLTSAFLTVSTFLPIMIEQHSGTIMTMSSAAARQPAKSSAAYAAAKAGVIALTRHLAMEFGHEGIRVNCLAPSAIENDRMRTWVSDADRISLGAAFPLGRLGQPDDIAAAALFLGSSASSWITGTTLDIAGGKVMV